METSVSERIKFIIKSRAKGNKSAFGRAIGVTPQAVADILETKEGPGFKSLSKILKGYPEISPDWLILGQGEMLRATPPEEVDTVEETGYRLNPADYQEPDGHPFGVRLLAVCQDASGRVASMMVRPEELLQELLQELAGRVEHLEKHCVEQLTA